MTEQIFSDRIKAILLELIETLILVMDLSVEIEDIISTIIEKIDIDSKISLVFSTPKDIGRTKVAA